MDALQWRFTAINCNGRLIVLDWLLSVAAFYPTVAVAALNDWLWALIVDAGVAVEITKSCEEACGCGLLRLDLIDWAA